MAFPEPTILGRYRILGELGRGAMGTVYLAEDPLLKRELAVKVVSGGTAESEDMLARFQREAEIAAQLHHPHVVTVFDVGEEPGIGPFLAMEYVDGVSLQEHLASGALAASEAMELLVQGASALGAAHRAGILHRDIKPGNFMLSRNGQLKLMDFGIARPAAPLVTTGLLCTPAYAAPELLKAMPPSEATDRWAFAVTAFQCLTGRLPFDRPSLAATLSAITSDAPDLEPLLPELQAVFQRALAKDPEARHPQLEIFLMDLLATLPLQETDRLRLGSSLGLLSVSQTQEELSTQKLVRRRKPIPWGWVLGFSALLVLLAGGWLTGPFSTRKLTVLSKPRGAVVLVDGKVLGTTPLAAARIPPFAKQVRLELEGHDPLVKPLPPGDGRLDLELRRSPLRFAIRSEPAGAEILLDGKSRGLTPLAVLEVPGEGRHRIELHKEGFEAWSMVLTRTQPPPELILLKPAKKDHKTRKNKSLLSKFKDIFR